MSDDTTTIQPDDASAAPGQLREQPIRDAMGNSFLDYAMSVITSRALPDVRDGLKPVHRRILWAMNEAGNSASKPYRKSARTVGDVIGKYHPHGDVSVYDAAVRMAQPFSQGHVLIDGQGNFGSIDGDSPAAMRYTEMRLSHIAGAMFADIHKETVGWVANYDGSEQEPTVLPTPFPTLLVNGGEGIAVGMASTVLPHNLGSVIDATLMLMERSDASTADIVSVLQAPDFPTGAIVHGLDGFAEAVETGRGRVKVRAKWQAEERARGAQAIVLTELPYQVNKSTLVEKIAALVRDGSIEDVADLRDESNKEGIRVWIGLKKDASPEAVFASLCAKTEAECSYSYNVVVLSGGRPRLIGLRQVIQEWIAFRDEVVLARHVFERKQALARLHILAGYMAALRMLDAVIQTIRGASSAEQARQALIELLSVDEAQAQAILDLKLQRLTGMELEAITNEHAQVEGRVSELNAIIASPQRIREIIRAELIAVRERYAIPRRTEIGHGLTDVTREDLIPREDVLLTLTQGGYVKRMPATALDRQNRGTRGKRALDVGEGDAISFLQQCHSHDSLLVFGRNGQSYGIRAYRIPEAAVTAKGRHIRNVIEGLDSEVQAVLSLPERDPAVSVLTITASGQVKRSSIEDYDGATRKGGVIGLGMEEGDSLVSAFAVRDEDHVVLVSSAGNAIRFLASDVRVMGRPAGGVRGMKLDEGETIVGAAVVPGGNDEGLFLLCAGEMGVGKRTALSEFPIQGRAGSGVIAFRPNAKTGGLVCGMGVRTNQDLVMLASNGVSNRIAAADVRETGRAASGVILMNLDEGARLVSVTTAVRTADDTAGEDGGTGATGAAGTDNAGTADNAS